MNPEKAHALQAHIEQLIQVGRSLQLPKEELKMSAWLGEVSGLLKRNFESNPIVLKQVDTLELDPSPPQARVDKAVSLLETTRDLIFIDPQSTASEALKALVEQTLLQEYFKRWEWRAMLAGFGVLAASLFGGTIFLDYKTNGVVQQANAARAEIASAKDGVLQARQAAVDQLQEKVRIESQQQMANLRTAIASAVEAIAALEKEQNAQKAKLIRQADDGQATIKTAIDGATAGISSTAKQTQDKLAAIPAEIQSQLNSKATSAITAVDDKVQQFEKRIAARVEEGQAQITTTIGDSVTTIKTTSQNRATAQLENLQAAIELSKASIANLQSQVATNEKALADQLKEKRGQIDGVASTVETTLKGLIDAKRLALENALQTEVSSSAQKATAQIQEIAASFSIKARNFDDSMKDKTTFAINRVDQFNEIVRRYTAPIDEVLARLQGSEPVSSVGTVARILGFAVWLVVGALVVSTLALLVALAVLIFRRRPPPVAGVAG